MKHILAFSENDSSGRILDLFVAQLPTIKTIFDKVIIGFTPSAERHLESRIEELKKDNFIEICFNEPGSLPGEHWMRAMKRAVEISDKEDVIHFCNGDRLVFALAKYKEMFMSDMWEEKALTKPILYQRSAFAWSKHPGNYQEIEKEGVMLAKRLWNEEFDIFWSSLAMQGDDWKNLLTKIEARDFTILVEIVYHIKDNVTIKKVDWLAWEDAYILGVDEDKLRRERERSEEENKKRWGYVRPAMEWMLKLKQ